MSLIHYPPLLHWRRAAANGMTPAAGHIGNMITAANHVMAYRHREIFSRSWALNSYSGYVGTNTIARWRWRSGLGATRLRVVAVCGAAGGSGVTPTIKVKITNVGTATTTTVGDWTYGAAVVAKFDAPDEWGIFTNEMVIAASSEHTGLVELGDYGKILALTVYEIGEQTISEATPYMVATIAQHGQPLVDRLRERMVRAASDAYEQNGGTMLHWGRAGGTAQTRTSITPANLIDGTTTGAPTAATPGVHVDLTYRNTAGRTTVPVEMSVYGSSTDSLGTVTLVDSGGATVGTVTLANTVDAWFSATFSMPTAAGKYDLQFRSGAGATTCNPRFVTIQEWEA